MGLANIVGMFALLVFISALLALLDNFITVANEGDVSTGYFSAKEVEPHISTLDSYEHDLLVFVQITDLHISIFTDPERYEHLNEFCSVNLKTINPRLVLATGDLTDAIAADRVIANQYEEEWKLYHQFYTKCQNESGVKDWLDLRGNHDNFNVNGYNSSSSYYPKFGAQRSRNRGAYMVTIPASNSTNYAFVGVDATLDLGPKRILNFVGHLDEARLKQLKKMEQRIAESAINASVWFGHYPTSSIFSDSQPGLRQIAAKAIAYVCGHYHTFGGLVPHMYSHHHSGMLELELADWKANRMYRIAAFDRGLFSFADVKHSSWPAIVITNPKAIWTVQPSKEPTKLMATSSHVRLLIFSPSPVKLCEIRINSEPWRPCRLTGEKHPLYTAPWQPSLYAIGIHKLEVRAKDSSGSEAITKIEFSLDGSKPFFPVMARLALMMDITTLFYWLFLGSTLLCTVPFVLIRVINYLIIHRKISMCRIRNNIVHVIARKLWIFATVEILFYPLTLFGVYLIFGPWFVGHLIDGRIGVVFAWCTIFEGITLPGTFSYFFGFTHVVLFHGLLVPLLGHTADTRFQELFVKSRMPKGGLSWRNYLKHTPFWAFIICHTISCVMFWRSYGYLATFVNPMRTWSLFMAIYLWHKATRLNGTALANFAKVWV